MSENLVSKKELKKCIAEIFDMLYDECEWYREWYLKAESEEERNLDKKVFEILNSRINNKN